MPEVIRHPLEWYIAKIERGEPFSFLTYGDGEFFVASRKRTGQKMQYGEIVTSQMEDEMIGSLEVEWNDIIRGTDANILNPQEYKGRDWQGVQNTAREVAGVLSPLPSLKWVDAVFWENAVRECRIGQLLRVIRGCVLVANTPLLEGMRPILGAVEVAVPGSNAFSEIDRIESDLATALSGDPKVCVVCMGLGAIPLIIRAKRHPEAVGVTFIDLGSVLDVFIRGSGGRGWRNDLYNAAPDVYRNFIKANLRGL